LSHESLTHRAAPVAGLVYGPFGREHGPVVELAWRGSFLAWEVSALHAEGFEGEGPERDWWATVEQHSLGWVTARRRDKGLVGFVNVAWDGAEHAFLLDTVVAVGFRRDGIGASLVRRAVEGPVRRGAVGCTSTLKII